MRLFFAILKTTGLLFISLIITACCCETSTAFCLCLLGYFIILIFLIHLWRKPLKEHISYQSDISYFIPLSGNNLLLYITALNYTNGVDYTSFSLNNLSTYRPDLDFARNNLTYLYDKGYFIKSEKRGEYSISQEKLKYFSSKQDSYNNTVKEKNSAIDEYNNKLSARKEFIFGKRKDKHK